MNAERTTNVLVYSIVGTAALLGYGFALHVGYVFLVPFSIIIPMSYHVRRACNNILFMGTYIYVAIEQETNLRWETLLFNIRKQETLKRRFVPHMFEYILVYDFLSFVCIGLSLFFLGSWSVEFILTLSSILLYLIWWNYAMWDTYSFRRQKEYETEIRQLLTKM